MNCPYCEHEMLAGYVPQEKRGLVWKQELEAANPYEYQKSAKCIKLSSLWKTGKMKMYYCQNCRKFIVDENELEV